MKKNNNIKEIVQHNRMWRQGMKRVGVRVFEISEPTKKERETALKNKKQRFENMMKIKKSQIEIYRLRLEQGNFADISIDEYNNAGRISIASSWGNWSNYWGACGESFKQFLIGLDIHYAAGKFGAFGYCDIEKTVENWKADVHQAYSAKKINLGLKIAILKQVDECSNCSKDEFKALVYNQEALKRFYHYMPPLVETIHPQFAAFWEKAWQPLVAHLKEELQTPKPVGTDGLKELAKRM